MNEEKPILSLVRVDGGVCVETHTHGLDDLYAIAYTVAHVCMDTPILLPLLVQALNEVKDKEDDTAVEMPDFDKLLKDIK